jgi:hypothetical protein
VPNYRCNEKIETQRGKEGIKSEQFNQQVGATAGCTLRLLLDTIPQDLKTISME